MKSLVHLTWLAKICLNTEDVFTIEDIDGKFVQSAFRLVHLARAGMYFDFLC